MKLINPYNNQTEQWLKGQVHLHTTNSDGHVSPANAVRSYEQAGYDFIAFTDHEVLPKESDLIQPSDMTLLSGVEYSCNSGDYEVGILGIKKLPRKKDSQRNT